MTARTLLILRHASAADVPGTADVERPLTPLGRTEATHVGRQIAAMHPDHVFCSPARRTRQTWDQISAQLKAQPTIDFEPGLYQAGPDTLREQVWQTPDEATTLLLIGHNPAVHELAWQLLGNQAPQHFPPASLAVVRFPGKWTDLP
ncbi:phosphohistidine phosphatase [Kibdelosporangium banguiense]|uniref:Phosphohistidine phosphatase n=1 Tax=Kibdelosporangium banguiense TaxID=1365924 RepID=A0ABS4TEC5_9PSEU|nr:histidine phosphatase family protein [Kibdelosporangium banguiense]MBP2322772.1 phosphohistidine phosphatase [Kibdelosporangium banguiense]